MTGMRHPAPPAPDAPADRARWRRRAAALAAAGVLVLAACGDDDGGTTTAAQDTSSTTTAAPAGPGDYGGGTSGGDTSGGAGTVVAQDFSLTSITVPAGSDVKVENQGSAPHTVTADDGEFDSGTVSGGSSGSFTAPSEPGDYPFHCELHPNMTGTLTVEG